TPQHLAYRATQRDLRVFRLTCGNADQLNALIRGDNDTECGQEAFPAAGKEAAVSGQVTETNRVPAVTETKEDDTQTHNNHHDNGGDFDHRKPELDFTVKANGGKVRQRHKPYGDERGYPLGHLREPELHVAPDGGDLRNPDGHPHKPVRPGREI